MDGWESQRKREPGHDFAIVRLGAPGRIHGALVDTTHFKGNAPQEVSLEGLVAPRHRDTGAVARVDRVVRGAAAHRP
jgi:allantoicase